MAVKRIARLPGFFWLIVAVGIGLSLLASHQVYRSAEASAQEQFGFAADQVMLSIEERLSAYALVLRGAAGLFDASEKVTRQEWRSYFDKLRVSDAVTGVQAIGYTVRLSPEELSRHEAEVRAEGFPDYHVYPDTPRDTYTAIVYLEPFEGRNLGALGYDMFTEPVRRAAMEQARDTGMAALTGRVMLVQETETQPSTLMYVPVYRRGAPLESVAQRREALIGWTSSPYRMYDLMEGILGDWEQRDGQPVGLRIYDGDRETAERLLFSNKPSSLASGATPFQQQRLIEFNGTPWRLVFDHLTPGEAVATRTTWLTLLGGLIITALLGALVLSLSTARARALRMAGTLMRTVREREQELETLLTRLKTIADRVPGVVYEYRLQPSGRACFPYASDGIQQVYGVTPESVREDASPMLSVTHPDDLDGMLASIRRSAETLTPWRHEYRVIHQDGAERWLFGDSLPHREPDGDTTWFGVITDITERKQSEIALRTANMEAERFREALDHVGSIIYMKDRDSRYTFANRATLDFFGCTAESLLGSEDARFFSSDVASRQRKIDVRVLNGEPTTEEVSLHDAAGHLRVYLEVKTPIREDNTNGNIIGLLGISTDITQLKDHERQLEYLALYDPLTGLPNRVLLADRLTHAMAQEHRQGRHLAMVYLDLDGFKQINDRYGHAAGDHLLIRVAQRMKGVMREGDTLSRLGGDEFVAVLQDLADESVATGLFERLLDVASQPVWYQSHALRVTASLGVSFYPQADPVEADQLLRQADQAMYQAKLAGKGRYHLFDAERDRSMRSHHETLERIQQGLQEGEFRLHYQPKVNMRTGKTIGVEALVRWQHPERGLLLPAQFLPVIEEHSLSEALGEWVIRSALAQAAAWRLAGLDLPVSVNVSARQLRQRDLVARLKRLLGDHPELPPGALELEVLETSTLGDLSQASSLLEGCRQIGIQVSLDDFGTGYSSLTYLKRLPASIVKIDQSFVHDILDNPEDLKILDGIFSLATAFDRQVIAEGVETVHHGDMLLRVGCEMAQGHGIARPMPAEAVPGWLHDWRPPAHWATLPFVNHTSRPLLYAGAEHRSWVRQIASRLTSEEPEGPPLDASWCGFCQWLVPLHDAMGPEIERLERLHRQAQRLAADLFALQDAGEGKQAIDRLPELYDQRDALLQEIERLLS
ncbi:MAG: EAL domain-containing protein [Halomonas sp.]|uniref:bifunctional diguanylate cyclase/phosphodiesterase n=1 Tax=Halomonas sp. TaxID=1486246 RepID=UPI0019DF7A9E|nr:EAL domain-containing protein [Halomonas sp.]MBE0488934.1 EAL domain-containing protein [Halomonas sp.]